MSPIVPSKHCPGCNRDLPRTWAYFSDSNSSFDGFNTYCKDCANSKSKDWRERNPDKWNEINRRNSKQWRSDNPQRVCELKRTYRARKRNAGGNHTAEDVNRIYEFQQGYCWWCGKPLNGKYHVDHRIPLSRGGSDKASNLVCACAKCNLSKSDKMPWEWKGH